MGGRNGKEGEGSCNQGKMERGVRGSCRRHIMGREGFGFPHKDAGKMLPRLHRRKSEINVRDELEWCNYCGFCVSSLLLMVDGL